MAKKFKCTRCGWEGTEDECPKVPVCPDCTTGHNKLYRIMRQGDILQCPNCAWNSTFSNPLEEPECPKCRDQYLKVIG